MAGNNNTVLPLPQGLTLSLSRYLVNLLTMIHFILVLGTSLAFRVLFAISSVYFISSHCVNEFHTLRWDAEVVSIFHF